MRARTICSRRCSTYAHQRQAKDSHAQRSSPRPGNELTRRANHHGRCAHRCALSFLLVGSYAVLGVFPHRVYPCYPRQRTGRLFNQRALCSQPGFRTRNGERPNQLTHDRGFGGGAPLGCGALKKAATHWKAQAVKAKEEGAAGGGEGNKDGGTGGGAQIIVYPEWGLLGASDAVSRKSASVGFIARCTFSPIISLRILSTLSRCSLLSTTRPKFPQ